MKIDNKAEHETKKTFVISDKVLWLTLISVYLFLMVFFAIVALKANMGAALCGGLAVYMATCIKTDKGRLF